MANGSDIKLIDGSQEASVGPVGGSKSDAWSTTLAEQIMRASYLKAADPETSKRLLQGSLEALAGIAPRDEIEGMLTAQLIVCHHAAMECFRRAATTDQPGLRNDNFNHANKLLRTHAMLIEALNRHRGKGGQRVTVEHVHVHSGAQAVVGNVAREGGRIEDEEGRYGIRNERVAVGDAGVASLPREVEADQAPLRATCSARLESLPLSRGGRRSAQG